MSIMRYFRNNNHEKHVPSSSSYMGIGSTALWPTTSQGTSFRLKNFIVTEGRVRCGGREGGKAEECD